MTAPIQLSTRDDLPALLNARGLVGTGVEVGVQEGRFSAHLLEHWDGERLVSVDPWKAAGADEYRDFANVSQDEHDLFYLRTRARLIRYRERSDIWRMTSLEAAEKLMPYSLDFVYIDARHDYDAVLEDLAAWHGKVRPGGILAGHDYLDMEHPTLGSFGVKSAVDEFFAARNIKVWTTTDDPPFHTWLVETAVPGVPTGSP